MVSVFETRLFRGKKQGKRRHSAFKEDLLLFHGKTVSWLDEHG